MNRKWFEVIHNNTSEPLPDIAICSQCNWCGPISECGIDEQGEGDWETGYISVDLCPKCLDGGCIDDYGMSEKQAEKWEIWWRKTHHA